MKARAFSLIEVFVAIAISSIIVVAAVSAFVSISRTTKKMEQQAHADEEAKTLTDWLMSRVQQTGGGQLRPWMVLQVDDDDATACDTPLVINGITLPVCDDAAGTGSDRLHAVIAASGTQCPIVALSAPGTSLTSSGTPCCLDSATFLDQTVVLAAADDPAVGQGVWRTRRITAIDDATCTATLSAVDAAYSSPRVPATGAPVTSAMFVNGFVTPATTHTFYVEGDGVDRILYDLSDDDNDGTPTRNELADHVIDFQVQLGFDQNGDQIADAPFSDGYGANPRANLRMIRIGLVIAAPAPSREAGARAQLFNGPVRTFPRSVYLRTATTRSSLRNLDIFF